MILVIIILLIYLLRAMLSGIKNNKKYNLKYIKPQTRLSFYYKSIINSWVTTIICLVIIFIIDKNNLINTFTFNMSFNINIILKVIIIIISMIIILIYLKQIYSLATNEEYRLFTWQSLDKNNNGILDEVAGNMLIPRSVKEKKIFPFVAFSAGFCEEFLTRFIFFYILTYLFPHINLLILPIITGVIFGLAHSYQGSKGIIKTGVVGIILGFIYLAYSSIIPGIIIHFLIDFMVNFIYPNKKEDVY
ncbi:MAG: CPBP family intramembrane metalloprotease [Bacilli bacterium]|jgi:membrane protease YdiL (CAAX protease family)|nr:CPBP family intramembrane metalloprotease [Bacilli bacterium]